MKDINPIFTDKLEENQQAQEINSVEEIDNNNPEPVIEITNPTPNTIEDMIDPIPEFTEDVADTPPTPEAVPVPVIEELRRSKNTVRIMDGGFTF